MSEEEIEYIKHCGEHFVFLTGGRGHSKTKQIIEQLQQENQQLKENNMSMQEEMARTWEKVDLYKEVIEEVREYVDNIVPCIHDEELLDEVLQILDKVKEGNNE